MQHTRQPQESILYSFKTWCCDDKLWYFDKKKFLKAYDLLLFPEKRLNLILSVVYESDAGLISAKAILKSFIIFLEQLPNINNSKLFILF